MLKCKCPGEEHGIFSSTYGDVIQPLRAGGKEYPGVQDTLLKLECSYSGKKYHGFWFNILLITAEMHMTLFHLKPFLDTSSLRMTGFFRLAFYLQVEIPFSQPYDHPQTQVKLSIFHIIRLH